MKKMKLALMTIALAAISTTKLAAMNLSEIRNEARFLTDRMSHELRLSNRQYEDVYEINFDFLYQANEVIVDMIYGYDDAIDYYYYLLDIRNEDLMYVLRSNQYHKFVNRDYFYRPLHMVGRTWRMRIWDRYTDRTYFYFGAPTCYLTYNGAHGRIHFNLSYYANRYSHNLFLGAFRLWGAGYDHHAHDGWNRCGQRKYATVGSRPWSNAKNYEKSRRNLKEGYVNVPSRDENKRKVMFNSEENRRTAMKSDTPILKRGKAPTGVHNNHTGKSSSRPTSSVRNSQRDSNVGTPTQRSSSSSSSVRSSSTSQRSSSVSSSSQRSNATSLRSSSTSSQRSNNSSVSSKASSGTNQRSSSRSSGSSSSQRSSGASTRSRQ